MRTKNIPNAMYKKSVATTEKGTITLNGNNLSFEVVILKKEVR